MGDPLSVAASVAGLLSLGLRSTEYLYKYYTACRDQHQDLAKIADQLGSLLESVQIVDEIVRTRTWRPNEQSILQCIEMSITRSEEAIKGLQGEVDKFKNEPNNDWRKKVVSVGRRAAYPFKRSTLEDLGDDVSEFRGNLSIALQALQLKEHQNTQGDIEEVNAIVKDIQARSVSADLRQWLRAPDATVNFNVAVAKRHASTGQWLVQGPAYTTWLQQDNSFLWLYGFAGCGKSVLCSTAIQHAFRRRQSSADSAVAFFFFDFRDESKQDASAMLRALLLQLCGQVPGLELSMTRLKDLYNHGTPPVNVLLKYLQEAAQCRHIYILLDALDESPEEISRTEVLSVINTLRRWQLPRLHLLVTSRDVPDIRNHLKFPTLQQGVEHISLKNDSIQQDISKYVAFQIDYDPQLQRWGDHREKIKSYLTKHAGGVFRWVECQLRPLRQCAQSEKHLEKCLRKLPQSLDETYERILCSIESREEAQQILSLLCFASRPLSVEEVVEALAVDIDDLQCYDPRSKFIGGAEDILRICPGLIEITLRTDSVQVLRIEHFSVQEYLLSDRIRKGQAADFALSGPSQHGRISKTCLLYLQHDEFLQRVLSPDLVRQYTFAKYAAEHWHHHYRQAGGQCARQLSEMVRNLLMTRCTKERWLRLRDPDRTWSTNVDYSTVAKDYPSATYYASLLGLDEVLMFILSMSAADVNAQGGRYSNALQAASQGGHEKVVQILLDKGADVNAQGGDYDNALQAASQYGHEKVVQILLDKGADVNAQGGDGDNALRAASLGGYEKVVQILLDKGADVNAQGDFYGNALQAASQYGHEKIVQILLDKGADVNAQGGLYGNALQAASQGGHEKVVQILLDKGVDVNAQGGDYGNALQAASQGGHEKMVQILLDKGVDVNAQGGLYGNALQAASQDGHEKIVQILLDKGADVNAQGGADGNALQAASLGGYEKVVQILLDKGTQYFLA
ncbi:uncharacterized protein Z519_02446 [Cladophialophora bantiana CBS 173.52]|uniref:NACHT domain-containing protein n=1 Tax=Cladophialophora bantiana (strain ATCC 10958 / CBS 173.52 / CDC B-1940 / NIH 8579) TaxID=1442370 RepID=A0A0D2IJV9_CLAB1|nr:uncharacterized protein Z519_02446 [Cladophialophora bantiana CBS 173.52]KIW97054.1 hypothetical protein Z519_02446 [Cladophialophora bantiana CBS 173.52]